MAEPEKGGFGVGAVGAQVSNTKMLTLRTRVYDEFFKEVRTL